MQYCNVKVDQLNKAIKKKRLGAFYLTLVKKVFLLTSPIYSLMWCDSFGVASWSIIYYKASSGLVVILVLTLLVQYTVQTEIFKDKIFVEFCEFYQILKVLFSEIWSFKNTSISFNLSSLPNPVIIYPKLHVPCSLAIKTAT